MFNVPMRQCVKSKVTIFPFISCTCYMGSLTSAIPSICHIVYVGRGRMGRVDHVNDKRNITPCHADQWNKNSEISENQHIHTPPQNWSHKTFSIATQN